MNSTQGPKSSGPNIQNTNIVSIKGVNKSFGSFQALTDISLEIRQGEIFALLGPSGCGKSTLLRIISGFETATSGQLLLDGKDMGHLPPNKRPTNMVFQSYAVFPHMSVEKNVAYGLKMEGTPKGQIKEKVEEALAQVHLTDFANRMPDQLSGGQRQRVALARALVKRPRVLLLDEPLSALDAKLRDAMRMELVKLQESVGISFVIVTHDQNEAMAIADRVAVLDQGKLRQIATPIELYNAPIDAFVADFIGHINFFSGKELSTKTKPDHVLAVRPENMQVTIGDQSTKPKRETFTLSGTLGDVAFQGDKGLIEIMIEGRKPLMASVPASEIDAFIQATHGQSVTTSWAQADTLELPIGDFRF